MPVQPLPAWVDTLPPLRFADVRVELDVGADVGVGDPMIFTIGASTPQIGVTFLEVDPRPDYWVLGSTGRRGTLGQFRLNPDRVDTPGPDPTIGWADITCFVRSIESTRTRRSGVDSFDPAQVTIELDNADRRFDPTNLAGPYVLGGETLLGANRQIRVRALWGGSWWPIAHVWSDEWPVTYSEPGWSTTTVRGRGAMGLLADVDPPEQPLYGNGLRMSDHLRKVVALALLPPDLLDSDTGDVELQSHTFAGNCLSTAKRVADSEGGTLFDTASGTMRARSRRHRLTDPRSTNSTLLTDSLATDPGGVFYSAASVVADAAEQITVAYAARVGGTQQTAVDGDAVRKWGPRSWRRSDLLCRFDADALDLAQLRVQQFATTQVRFAEVEVQPTLTARAAWLALRTEIGDRFSVKRRPLQGFTSGSVISRDAFVEGITHRLNIDRRDWSTRFALSDATAF